MAVCSLCDDTGWVMWELVDGAYIPRKATYADKDEMQECPACDHISNWEPPHQFKDV